MKKLMLFQDEYDTIKRNGLYLYNENSGIWVHYPTRQFEDNIYAPHSNTSKHMPVRLNTKPSLVSANDQS